MTSLLLQIGVSVAGGAILLAIKLLLSSRDAQGKRIGNLEKWIDREEGRRLGYAEGMREGQRLVLVQSNGKPNG